MLANKVGFVTGLASKHSIASAVAKVRCAAALGSACVSCDVLQFHTRDHHANTCVRACLLVRNLQAWHQHGATVVIGVQSDRFVGTAEKLATSWGISQPNIVTCDVTCDDSVAAAMHAVAATSGGKLDALLHSVAFAPTPAMKECVVESTYAISAC